MKFLCIPCDSPMKLQTVGPPEGGSLSVVYSCPECGYEMAMLTNPFETQLVQSLGVRIGPETGVGASRAASASAGAPVPDARRSDDEETRRIAATSATRCPFPAMMPAMEGALEGARHATPTGAGTATEGVLTGGEARHVQAGEPIPVRWTSGAEARLANIPAFVRPMARTGIERFARERGSLEVDEKILDAARDFFGM
jgi:proto-chlorophyllide reductase subunit